jgi:predicted anti-sigma-YlaC factor YlaD
MKKTWGPGTAGPGAVTKAAGLAVALSLLLSACSVERLALRKVSRILTSSSGPDVFASDNDPDFVGQALPFAIKLFESLLASVPDNRALRVRTGSLYIMYANAFIEVPADMIPRTEMEKRDALLARAKNLYLRGRDILLVGLEQKNPDLRRDLQERQYEKAMAPFGRPDVDLLYWAALGWLAAYSVNPFDMTLGETVPRTRAMIDRVRALAPDYGHGSLDSFYVSYYGSLPAALGGDAAKAREYFAKAQALAGRTDTSSLIALATTVSVNEQNVAEFKALLGRVLAFDPDSAPETRLVNIINQRQARWLLAHVQDFFIETDTP